MLIAFVGSEAAGKSTLLAHVARRPPAPGPVVLVHAGKPPGTALTFLPHVLLPVFRRLFPRQRTTRLEAAEPPRRPAALLFVVRSAMLAYERRVLLRRCARRSARGSLVLCDRFPASNRGAPDGAQLGEWVTSPGLRGLLSRFEARCYAAIAPPDLVVHLSAPLAVTLARNAARVKREPEDYVRRRHAAAAALEFAGARVERIDTDRPFEETLRDVGAAIAGLEEARR